MPSTIDPSVIDPTKPETYPAVPTTADQRNQHQNIQDQFQNAQDDVNTLEASVALKEDAGTAAAAVTAHDGNAGAHPGTFDAAGTAATAITAHDDDPNAHPGTFDTFGSAAAVGSDLLAHESDFGNPHAVSAAQTGAAPSSHVGAVGILTHGLATATQAGFAPVLSNVATEFLNGTGVFSTPAGGVGEANTSSNSGAGVQLAQAKAGVDLPFRTLVSGDASVSFTQNANEIDIRSTGAGGGESNTSSTPATVGGNEADINMAKNGIDLPKRKLVGGATVTLTQSADAITIASTDGSAAVQANLDTHEADTGNPHATTVNQDATPVLGGDLQTKGSEIVLTRADDSVHGAVLAQTAITGAALYYTDTAGVYDSNNGAVEVGPGHVNLAGSVARVTALKHSDSTRQQVYADQGGGLYTVAEPDAGWSVEDTDAGDYDLGAPGTGVGAWVQMTALVISTGGDLGAGDRVDYSVTLSVVNKTLNRSGVLEIFYSVDGAVPGGLDVDDTIFIAAGFAGQLTLGGFDLLPSPVASGTAVTIYARAAGGSGVGYGLDLNGSVIGDHRLIVSVPGIGGGGNVTSAGTTDQRLQLGSADATGIEDSPAGSYSVANSRLELGATQVGTLEATGLAVMDAAQTTAATTITLDALTDNLVVASATGGITLNTGTPADPFWATIVFTDAAATVAFGTGTWYGAAPTGDVPAGAGKVLSVLWDGTSGKAVWVG